MDKKAFWIIGVITVFLFAVLFFEYIYPEIEMRIAMSITEPEENLPQPALTYGEFPFCLKYELNGETVTVEDSVVCEYCGYYPETVAGQPRKWKIYLKSGNAMTDLGKEENYDSVFITLLDLRDEEIYDDNGNKILELFFYGGSSHYFMNDDLGPFSAEPQQMDEVDYLFQSADGRYKCDVFSPDTAYDLFKLRLISWEIADPITNSFE